ncbi:probable pectate lyase [Serendipita indica DSM 11827]|uniref:Pectate lyase n=1 Tax=Serendipita indica (strain DSM 11827) TaxID=1109443 RepID=G4TWR8_SERID|nr:probable pectate lyase [Serendipita indica DSM 11827]
MISVFALVTILAPLLAQAAVVKRHVERYFIYHVYLTKRRCVWCDVRVLERVVLSMYAGLPGAATSTKTTSTTRGSTSTPTTPMTPTGITTKLPPSSGYVALPTTSVISGSFDGGMKRYDRAGSSGGCQGQTETGESDAVFSLQPGATISNVIIGANQAEGIHCQGTCRLVNIWWQDVCEDAATFKQTGSGDVSYVIGGGAFHASDKIFQHNGAGTVSISNFYASDFGKLYRACGNCAQSYRRNVIVNNARLESGSSGVGINTNFGDTARFTNVCSTGKPSVASTTPGNEPTKIGWYVANLMTTTPD